MGEHHAEAWAIPQHIEKLPERFEKHDRERKSWGDSVKEKDEHLKRTGERDSRRMFFHDRSRWNHLHLVGGEKDKDTPIKDPGKTKGKTFVRTGSKVIASLRTRLVRKFKDKLEKNTKRGGKYRCT